jgi:hypothetical protein
MPTSKAVLSGFLGAVVCVTLLAAVELGTGDVQGAGSCKLVTHRWKCNECAGTCTSSDVCTATRTSSCFRFWTEPDACSCVLVWSPQPAQSDGPTVIGARAACLKGCASERDSCKADAHEDRTATDRCDRAFKACVEKCPGIEDRR